MRPWVSVFSSLAPCQGDTLGMFGIIKKSHSIRYPDDNGKSYCRINTSEISAKKLHLSNYVLDEKKSPHLLFLFSNDFLPPFQVSVCGAELTGTDTDACVS